MQSKRGWFSDSHAYTQHLVFQPVRNGDGKIVKFTLRFTLAAFKGYSDGELLRIVFTLVGARKRVNLPLDLSVPLLALLLYRGALPFADVDEMLKTDLLSFTVKEDFADQPVFLARTSRTRLSDDQPMTLNSANVWFQDILKSYGIHTGVVYGCSLYACRRGFATELHRNYSALLAKWFLGHKPNSSLLHSVYDQTPDDIDVLGGVTGEGNENERVGLLPSETRVPIEKDGAKAQTARLREDPSYLHRYGILKKLRLALQFGSTGWMREPPVSTDCNGVLVYERSPC